MTFLWIALTCVAALLWLLTIADIVRKGYTGWALAGWIALVLLLPLLGALVYWVNAGRAESDPEKQAMAAADIRRTGPSR